MLSGWPGWLCPILAQASDVSPGSCGLACSACRPQVYMEFRYAVGTSQVQDTQVWHSCTWGDYGAGWPGGDVASVAVGQKPVATPEHVESYPCSGGVAWRSRFSAPS
jgi:hypothetical protein